MKYNVYKISNCDYLGYIESDVRPLSLEENDFLSKFEPLFKKYDENLFNTRFKNGDKAWFIVINAETLKPDCEISYFINDGSQFIEVEPKVYRNVSSENDIEFNDVLFDIPEHNTRATFFDNLYRKFVDLEKLI